MHGDIHYLFVMYIVNRIVSEKIPHPSLPSPISLYNAITFQWQKNGGGSVAWESRAAVVREGSPGPHENRGPIIPQHTRQQAKHNSGYIVCGR